MNRTPVLNRRALPHFDWMLVLVTFALAIFGVVAVTAATYRYSEESAAVEMIVARVTSSDYGSRQALFLLISPFVIAAMMLLSYRIFEVVAFPLYVASLVLLVAVLLLGSTTSGVTGWFELFSGYMLQPSEFAKVAVILQLARFFSRRDNPVTSIKEFGIMVAIMFLPVALIFGQGEMGTAMVFIAFYLGMMFVSGMRLRIIAGVLAGGVVGLVSMALYFRATGSYRYARLAAFLDPSQATADAIYQARNSQIAIGNGGLRGTGAFVDGTYTALNYVPQDHTDFIFASIGETMGFVGCVGVILLYAVLLFRMLSLARNTYDKFARLVIVGVFSMMFFHIFYNIGMTTGVMPVMGIPLPFLSYGGSNLTANMAGIGLVLNITLRKPEVRAMPLEEAARQAPSVRRPRRRRLRPKRI